MLHIACGLYVSPGPLQNHLIRRETVQDTKEQERWLALDFLRILGPGYGLLKHEKSGLIILPNVEKIDLIDHDLDYVGQIR